MQEGDLPGASLFHEEGRLQPFQFLSTGSIGDAAFIDVSNPRGVSGDVNVGRGHVPVVLPSRGMVGLDERHDGVSVEPGSSVVHVKVWRNQRVKLRGIVCASGREYSAEGVYDLRRVGASRFLLGPYG